MITKTYEITLTEPVSDAEIEWLDMLTTEEEWELAVNQSRRIVLVAGPEDVRDLIKVLAQNEFADDIGLIREIVEYEPIYDDQLFDLGITTH